MPYDIPNTDDMAPKHGFASGLFGRRTRSFGRGGSGRWVTDWTALPCGLGTIFLLYGSYAVRWWQDVGGTGARTWLLVVSLILVVTVKSLSRGNAQRSLARLPPMFRA